MMNVRHRRAAANAALGYAADARGNGIAYAAIGTGDAPRTIRLPFTSPGLAAFEGLDAGYAAVAALAAYLKRQGFERARIAVADGRVVGDLTGVAPPPRALEMLYVRSRCALLGLGGPVDLQADDTALVRDLTARAKAESTLTMVAA